MNKRDSHLHSPALASGASVRQVQVSVAKNAPSE